MYFEQFGLSRPPFEETTNPVFFHETGMHRAILSEVHRRLDRGGLILIEGDPGAGKSMLGHVLMQRLERDADVLSMALSPSESPNVLERIHEACDCGKHDQCKREGSVRCTVQTIVGRKCSRFVALIHQAERLRDEDLVALRSLVRSGGEAGVRISLVLIADAEIQATLRAPKVVPFADEIIRTPRLTRMDKAEAAAYVATRFRSAGGTSAPPFTTGAIERMVAWADGYPRRINAIAKLAMTRAARQQMRTINEDMIIQCASGMSPETDRPPAAAAPASCDSAPRMVEATRFEEVLSRLAAAEARIQHLESRTELTERFVSEAEQFEEHRRKLHNLFLEAEQYFKTVQADETRMQQALMTATQVTETVKGLEQRVSELQEGLASPLSVIQDAQAQAEELNDICLAVKRVFRGVSRASLEAYERTKTLGKFLAACERAEGAMRQWVEEAVRAQQRLCATLDRTPSVRDSHPLPEIPEKSRESAPADADSLLNGADLAVIRRIAAGAEAEAKPQARKEEHGAAQSTVIPAKLKPGSGGGGRIRPEEVQALIDAARKKATRVGGGVI